MDKNTLVGFILIGAVIVGFGIYNRPSQEERARAQTGTIRTLSNRLSSNNRKFRKSRLLQPLKPHALTALPSSSRPHRVRNSLPYWRTS